MKIKFLSALLAVLMFVGAFSTIVLPVSAAEEEKEIDEIIAEHLTKTYASPEAKLEVMTKKLDKNGYELWVLAETGEIAFVDKASGQITFSNPWNIATGTESESTKKEIMSQIFINYNNNGQAATMNSFEEAAQRGQILVKNIKNGVRIEYTIGREETRLLVPRYIKQSRFEKQIAKPIFEGMIADGIMDATELASLDYLDYVHNKNNIRKTDSIKAFYFFKFMALYNLKDPNDPTISEELKSNILQTWPATKKVGAIFVIAADVSTNELRSHEQTIKKYCVDYTYEELDKDHVECQYEGTDIAPPLFKMALEYTIDDWGLIVTLPASGIRFNESLYKLDNIEVLPYMGAGSNPNSGYTFFPDGSGTLFDFEDLDTKQKVQISGKVYGADYAYHTITGTHQEIIRYPVFGIVENRTVYANLIGGTTGGTTTDTSTGDTTTEAVTTEAATTETTAPADTSNETGTDTPSGGTTGGTTSGTKVVSSGLLCIIEEGDALATLTTFHGGATSKYNTVKMSFIPRPKDTYDLSGSLAVGTGSTWDVVSKRKYVGNYKVRYIMMTDQNIAKEKNIENTYEPTWLGMAKAYSDYLVSKGALKKLTEADVKEDIPLFIETFGTIETLEKILSVPVNVMTPLSSFEDIKTMYDELSSEGVGNINFKLKGYANGGIYAQIPADLKWEDAVGGDDGFEDLVKYAEEKDFGIFPDFDFVFVSGSMDKMFDSLKLKDHAVKTIDDRYTSKREYSATYQSYVSYYDLAISPEYFMYFYTKLHSNYSKFTTSGISVGTLGTNLNSNFDEDQPLNREDSKEYTVKLFEQLSNDYDNVMTDSGNAYSWSYVDYILNVPISSSRYIKSGNTVPFMGVVLHSFVQFAGTPTNMEGNISYAFLKAIENGSGIYFKLVYQNAEKLKEDVQLSQNYSVRYDIWKNDMIVMYNQLNELLKDVQLSAIVGHEFLTGYRVPDEDEAIADAEAKKEQEELEKIEAELAAAAKLTQDRYNGRVNSLVNAQTAFAAEQNIANYIVAEQTGYYYQIMAALDDIKLVETNLARANELGGSEGLIAKTKAEYDALVAAGNTADAATKKADLDKLEAEYAALCTIEGLKGTYSALAGEGDSAEKLAAAHSQIVINIRSNFNMVYVAYTGIFNYIITVEDNLALADIAAEYFTTSNGFAADLQTEIIANQKAVQDVLKAAKDLATDAYNKTSEIITKADAYLYDEGTPAEDKRTIVTYEEYLKSLEEEADDEEEVVEDEEAIDERYLDDSGNIILLTFENGKTFILNYNYFKVTVEVNGQTYEVDACGFDTETRKYTGYLIINEGGAE